jgi:predicted DNA-binding protein YlxM (UPF0122 family)
MLEKKLRFSKLLDIYGGLLTEYQLSISTMYIEEDLSLGEISESLNISRQAIHDNIKRTYKILEEYDEKLNLIKREKLTNEFLMKLVEMLNNNTKEEIQLYVNNYINFIENMEE